MFGPSGPLLSSTQRRRFAVDREILAGRFPDMRHLIDDHADGIAEGTVQVDVGNGVTKTVEIMMKFGGEYPQRPPEVRETGGRWVPHVDRHMYEDGSFCLGLSYVDLPDVATPESFALFLDRLLLFLRDQFTFDVTGRWPGPEWVHGTLNAYAQHIVETLGLSNRAQVDKLWPIIVGQAARPDRRCPCGSRLPYAKCHRRAMRDLRFVRHLERHERLRDLIYERIATS